MCDGSGVSSVVHHKHLQLINVVDDSALKTIGMDVTSLLVASVTDGGHGDGTTETSANTSVNTLGLAP